MLIKKIKEKAKHLLAAVLSLTTVGSGVAAAAVQTASAAGDWYMTLDEQHVDIGYDGFGYHPRIGDNQRIYMHNRSTGETLEVFCIQKKVLVNKDQNGYDPNGDLEAWTQLKEPTRQQISVAGMWYYHYHKGDLMAFTATQYYIWRLTESDRTGIGGDFNWASMQQYSTSKGTIAQYNAVKAYYDELAGYMVSHGPGAVPNFQPEGSVEQRDGKYVVNPGDTVTFVDRNGFFHLSEWEIDQTGFQENGITARKDGDKIIVSLGSEYAGNKTFRLRVTRFKSEFATDNRMLVFQSEVGGQATVYPHSAFNYDPSGGFDLQLISGRIKVQKYDSITNEAVSGATFEIYDAEGTKVQSMKTNYEGVAISDWLKYGEYTVKEVGVPTGYNKGIIVNVGHGQEWGGTEKPASLHQESVTVEFYDKPIQGSIKVVKVDESNHEDKLAGVQFDIHMTEDKLGNKFDTVVGKLTTNENGEATSGWLDYGKYYLVETQAAYGFFNDQKHYEFSITEEGQRVEKTIGNEQTKSSIDITKEDDNSDGHGLDLQGQPYKLAGAEFELWEHLVLQDSRGNTIDTKEVKIDDIEPTNDQGQAFYTKKLAYSDELQQSGSYYYLKEVKAPLGYYINEDEIKLEVTYQGQFVETIHVAKTVPNKVMKGHIEVQKVDKETKEPLAGAKFRILNDRLDVVGEMTSGADGIARSGELRPGTYVVHEIQAPENYNLASPITVVLKAEVGDDGQVSIVQEKQAIFEDAPKYGHLKIKKVDSLTIKYTTVCEDEEDLATCKEIAGTDENTKFLAGAEFTVYAKNDLDKVVAKGTTDANGVLDLDLRPGKYYVQETKAPDKYNENPELFEIEIVADETTEKLIGNQVIYGELEVYKIGEELVGTKDGEDGVTELVWHDTYQPNTKFDLTAEEDIKNPVTGEVAYEKGTTVREIITDETGKGSADNLPLGKYCVEETIAPEEHSLSENNKQCFEIKAEDANFEGVVETEATFMNERVIIDPTIYKQAANLVDKSNKDKGYTYADLAGAKFGIYNAEEIVSKDEKTKVAPDTLLATMVTKEDGTADVEVKLPFGKYYLKEIEAPSGYYLNEERYDFELVWKKEMQNDKKLVVNISDKDKPIINYEVEVPDTGVMINTAVLGGLAVIAVTGLVLVIAKKRKSDLAD